MNQDTLLHRQVHPNFVRNDRATSQAFSLTRRDEGRLSVYDGDLISPELAWRHYTQTLRRQSAGVISVTAQECHKIDLPVLSDPDEFPEHALIDFSLVTRGQAKNKAKQLRDYANRRDWQYRP